MKHTAKDYWNCRCEKDYIQPKRIDYCPFCDTVQAHRLDSRINEVSALGLRIYLK